MSLVASYILIGIGTNQIPGVVMQMRTNCRLLCHASRQGSVCRIRREAADHIISNLVDKIPVETMGDEDDSLDHNFQWYRTNL
eukprot:scaffold25842_cov198-Amphora_coffeaeformis.AAC.37